MDHLAVAIKTAEMMVDLRRLGIQPYRAGPWAPIGAEVRQLLVNELAAE